jgi:hypothetical protein
MIQTQKRLLLKNAVKKSLPKVNRPAVAPSLGQPVNPLGSSNIVPRVSMPVRNAVPFPQQNISNALSTRPTPRTAPITPITQYSQKKNNFIEIPYKEPTQDDLDRMSRPRTPESIINNPEEMKRMRNWTNLKPGQTMIDPREMNGMLGMNASDYSKIMNAL